MSPTKTTTTPTETPPNAGGTTVAAGMSAPTLAEQQGDEVTTTTSAGVPTASPPPTAGTLAEDGVTASTWRTGTVTALWSVDEVRNAHIHVSGLGWKKLYNGRDGAFIALLTLASQARQTGRTINFREEADGMVYEIYLW